MTDSGTVCGRFPTPRQAKKFVESLPKTLKENATKDEADKLAAAFKAIGAEVSLD